MKRFLFYEVLIGLTMAGGCTKDSGNSQDQQASNKVKTVTTKITSISYNYLSTASLSYDAQDRVVKAQSDSSTSIFTYQDNVIRKDFYQTGQPDQHLYYYLNTMSLADSVIDYAGNTDTIYWYYQYNSKNQLIQVISVAFNKWLTYRDTMTYQYNSEGDLSTLSFASGVVNAYEYYDTQRPHNSAEMLNPGAPPPTRLLKKLTFTPNMGENPIISNFTYELDKFGRILSENESIARYETIVTSYTYY